MQYIGKIDKEKLGEYKNKIIMLFEVVNFVPTTRRWQDKGNLSRCRRRARLPNNKNKELWKHSSLKFSVDKFQIHAKI